MDSTTDYAPPAPASAPQAADATVEQAQTAYLTPEYWARELQAARRWLQRWQAQARQIEKKYLLQAQEAERTVGVGRGEYPLFWSNVETGLASLYAQVPKVSVDRTHLDPNDDPARVAALILERIFEFEAEDLENSPYYVLQDCIQDRLVVGFGIAWARYEFSSQKMPLAPGLNNPDGSPITMEVITDERAPLEYVRWEDFLFSPCRRWQDKRWVARRVPMTRSKLVARFGGAAATVPLALKGTVSRGVVREDDPLRAMTEDQADVWEIWCGETKQAHWFVQGNSTLLDTKDDPLKLHAFYPVRRPLMASHLTNAYIPRPDYVYAKSQYEEMELIASRCTLLTEACKLVGVYDKASEGVQKILDQGAHNKLVPVDNWAMFAEKGGLKGQIDWMPLDSVVATLQYLTERKAALNVEVFEVLGISDIQRGMASTHETATTQRLKASFGSARAAKNSQDIARFISDQYRMRAEIICRHWQPVNIMTVSQIDKTPDAALAGQAIQLMKTDPTFAMRVKVSAENVTAPDWDLEKAQRVDFLASLSGFIASASPLVEKFPGTAKPLIQVVQWVASGFKGGKQIEGVMDQALSALLADQSQPKPPPPPTPQDRKDMAAAQKQHIDAGKVTAETMKILAEIGVPPETALLLPPSYDPTLQPPLPGTEPQASGPPPGLPPPGGPRPGLPAGPAGSMAVPPGPPQGSGMGGAPLRPPGNLPNLNVPGMPPLR